MFFIWPHGLCVSAAPYQRNVLLCPNSCPPLWAMLPPIWGSTLPLMSLKPPPLVWDTPASRAHHRPATATGTAHCGAPGALWWTATLTAPEPASSAQWTAATPTTAPTSAAGWLQQQQQRALVERPCQVSGCRVPPPLQPQLKRLNHTSFPASLLYSLCILSLKFFSTWNLQGTN